MTLLEWVYTLDEIRPLIERILSLTRKNPAPARLQAEAYLIWSYHVLEHTSDLKRARVYLERAFTGAAGLVIETELDQQHAAVTLAHSRLQSAEAHAAQLKMNAVTRAQADLEAAQARLQQSTERAQNDIMAARVERDRKADQARSQRQQGDKDAQTKRDAGHEQERQIKESGQTRAQNHRDTANQDANARVEHAEDQLKRL